MNENKNNELTAAPTELDMAENSEQEHSNEDMDTRRKFIVRLAKTAAAPVIVPIVLSMPTAALA